MKILSGLDNSENPQEGHLVYWGTKDYFVHVGVVFDQASLTMVHRREKKGLLETSSIEELTKYFGEPKYKVPNRFQGGEKS